MEKRKQQYNTFLKTISSHPRFSEIYDVLPKIHDYFFLFAEWEEDFIEFYLKKKYKNFYTWLVSTYVKKFGLKPVPPRPTYFRLKDYHFFSYAQLARILPFWFYFPQRIICTQRYKDYRALGDVYYRPNIGILVYIDLGFHDFTARINYVRTRHDSDEYKLTQKEFKSFFESLDFVQTHDIIVDRVKMKFELKNAPVDLERRPDFCLIFYKDVDEPVFVV